MFKQLSAKVNKAVAFCLKELLLTLEMTGNEGPDLIDQIWLIGVGMDVKHVKATPDKRCFFRM